MGYWQSLEIPTIGRNTLSSIENGDESAILGMTLAQWNSLCNVLGCSLGHIMGEFDAPSYDIQFIQDKTGMKPKAIQKLMTMNEEDPNQATVLSSCIEDFNFEYFIYLLKERIRYTLIPRVSLDVEKVGGKYKTKNLKAHLEYEEKMNININLDGANLPIRKKNLLDSLISTAIIDGMRTISDTFFEYSKKEETNGND